MDLDSNQFIHGCGQYSIHAWMWTVNDCSYLDVDSNQSDIAAFNFESFKSLRHISLLEDGCYLTNISVDNNCSHLCVNNDVKCIRT